MRFDKRRRREKIAISENVDWHEQLQEHIRQRSRCLKLQNNVVEQPARTLFFTEEVVKMGPDMKDAYGTVMFELTSSVQVFWDTPQRHRSLCQEYYARVILSETFQV